MMDFRQRLEQARLRPVDSEISREPEEDFACPYFATDKVKSPACLDLRLAGGERRALPYSYFMEINYEPETGIEIVTSSKRIKITGRNLSRLFEYLIAYRVRFVQANIGNDAQEDGLYVQEILVEALDD